MNDHLVPARALMGLLSRAANRLRIFANATLLSRLKITAPPIIAPGVNCVSHLIYSQRNGAIFAASVNSFTDVEPILS